MCELDHLVKWFIFNTYTPSPLKSEYATRAALPFDKNPNRFNIVAYLIPFLPHPLWKAAPFHQRFHAEVYSNFSEALASTRRRQKTRHKQKLILATGTAAVSNAFSCAGLGRL